jgi:uncharacterized membrane protein
MVPVDWEQVVAIGHLATASAALVAGAAVLLLPKGTRKHRASGTAYVVVLVLVDLAALALHRESTFGVFHGLAIASLVTLAVGLSPLLLGKRSPAAITSHAYCMTWSYVGLAAAGCGQLAVTVSDTSGARVVPTVIGGVLFVGGVVIFRRVPTTVGRVLQPRDDSLR